MNGRDWGTDGEWAFNVEALVRKALESSDAEIARAIQRYPQSVTSSYSPRGKELGWTTSDWFKVLVLTEGGIGDPFTYKHVHDAFDRAVELLNADPLEQDSDWMWDSINPAVQIFIKTPKVEKQKMHASMSGARAAAKPARDPKYADWYTTGTQDCNNAFEGDDFAKQIKKGGRDPKKVVAFVWANWERDGIKEGWLEQNVEQLDEEHLDHDKAFQAWAEGWREIAVLKVTEMVNRHLKELDDEEDDPRNNPASSDTDADEERAVAKYIEFNRLDPKEIVTDLHFEWPARMRCMGESTWVTYKSRKIIPDNMKKPKTPVDYIHEHDAGVKLYVPDGALDTELPKFIRECKALTLLGECTGFGFKKSDGKGEATGKRPYPELYCTPDGRALVVIQSKRDLVAIMFGGSLGVEGRGIVG